MTRPVGKGNEGTCTFCECILMEHESVRITEREKDRGMKMDAVDRQRGGVLREEEKRADM